MVLLGVGRHVTQLLDVAVPNPEGEHLDVERLEELGRGSRVAPVRVPVGDEKNRAGGIFAAVLQ